MKIFKFLFLILLIGSIFSCKKQQNETLTVGDGPKRFSSGNNFLPSASSVTLIVAKDGSGTYSTIQAAVNAVVANSSTRTVISVKNGTYSEVVTVPSNKINISIIGESETGVIITYGNAANLTNPATGSTYGTGGSATFFSNGAGLYVNNVTFQNSSGTANG